MRSARNNGGILPSAPVNVCSSGQSRFACFPSRSNRARKDNVTTTNSQRALKVLAASDPTTLALSIRASCLVFEDDKSKALLELVQRIAPSQATALIIGETGTGKELIARHIHELSDSTHRSVRGGQLRGDH